MTNRSWIAQLTPDMPVAVYCSYGFDVGRNVTKTLIERGFDARYIRGGVSAWYAAGGARSCDRRPADPGPRGEAPPLPRRFVAFRDRRGRHASTADAPINSRRRRPQARIEDEA